jgi:hypothetical protein
MWRLVAQRSLRSSPALALLAALGLTGCPEEPSAGPPDSGVPSFGFIDLSDDKTKIFPLVGRWYPLEEAKRLSNPALTPEEWCQRAPLRIDVGTDEASVQCESGPPITAGIASVTTSSAGEGLVITFRVAKDFPLRQLRFAERIGPRAMIGGNPCDKGETVQYTRFPEYEILTRQVLNGRRCSQIVDGRKPF